MVRREFPSWSRCCAAPTASARSRSPPTATCSNATRGPGAAGVDRFNVSVDSLARDAFFRITRRDALAQVMRGLEAIAAFPEVRPIKVNAIAMRDFTEGEVLRFCEFARSTDYQVRFIEFMPLDADRNWTPEAVLTGAEIREIAETVYELEELPREPHSTARVYRFADGSGEIGFVNPVSEPFCADCNRVRLTSDGKLRTCLFSIHETDLRDPLRSVRATTSSSS